MEKPTNPAARRASGFTLIELMIVVVVIAILAAVALPAYMNYVLRSHRTDATRALMEASSALERYFSQNQKYSGAALGTSGTGVIYPATSPEGFYTLTLTSDANTYTLTATRTGTQTKDTECGDYTLNSLGVRGNTGTASANAVSRCWNR